jgi:hypothetical protein
MGWLVATELWLATVWSLGRADHSHPSKHGLRMHAGQCGGAVCELSGLGGTAGGCSSPGVEAEGVLGPCDTEAGGRP